MRGRVSGRIDAGAGAGLVARRDLGRQFADHRVAEIAEIVDRQHEGAEAADDVVVVIFRQPAGRIGVQRQIAA